MNFDGQIHYVMARRAYRYGTCCISISRTAWHTMIVWSTGRFQSPAATSFPFQGCCCKAYAYARDSPSRCFTQLLPVTHGRGFHLSGKLLSLQRAILDVACTDMRWLNKEEDYGGVLSRHEKLHAIDIPVSGVVVSLETRTSW